MRGARVLATASGRDGIVFVRRRLADAAADGRRQDLAAAALAGSRRAVCDAVSHSPAEAATRLLDGVRPGGRIAFPNGVEPAPRRKRRGISVESYDATSGVPRVETSFGRAIAATRPRCRLPVVPLAQAAKAHARLAKHHVRGKIVLRVRRPLTGGSDGPQE